MIKHALAKVLRLIFNWKPVKEQLTEDCIVLYHHTSYIDFLPIFLNFDANWIGKSFFLVLPQIFNWFTTPVLRYLHVRPAARLQDKGVGTVQRVVDEFKKEQQEPDGVPVCCFLSPKGTIKKKEWRTGYYHLAKSLHVPVYVVVLDWIDRELTFHKVLSIEDLNFYTEKELRPKVESYLSLAMPLNPENSEIKLPDVKSENIGLLWDMLVPIDLCVFSMIFFIPTIIRLNYLDKYIHTALLQTSVLYSYLYHANKEDKSSAYGRHLHITDIFCSVTTFLYFMATASTYSYYYWFLLSLAIISFIYACPRGCTKNRGRYALLHPLFHMFAGMASYEVSAYI